VRITTMLGQERRTTMNKVPRTLSIGLAALVALAAVAGIVLLLAQTSTAQADAPKPALSEETSTGAAQIRVPMVITTVQFLPGIGRFPSAISVNPATGYAYVANFGSYDVTVISGTQVVTTLAAGGDPSAMGVNPASGYVYVANASSNNVTVISGTQVVTTLAVGTIPWAVGVNPASGYVYVANYRGWFRIG
jgi:YVTN family beta-propeller protein